MIVGQIFYFTYWTYPEAHSRNSASRNLIKEFAEDNDDLFYLEYPGWHRMNY